MSLKDEIQTTLVSDTESIMKSQMDRVRDVLEIHQDGSIDPEEGYRSIGNVERVLIEAIGRKFAHEAEMLESHKLGTQFLYDILPITDSTVRDKLQELREKGYLRKTGQSTHELVVENLPEALDWLEDRKDS